MCVQIIKAGGHMALSPLQRALKASSWPLIPPISVVVVVVVVVQVVDQNLTLLSPKLSKTAQSGLTTPADMHFTSLLFTIKQFSWSMTCSSFLAKPTSPWPASHGDLHPDQHLMAISTLANQILLIISTIIEFIFAPWLPHDSFCWKRSRISFPRCRSNQRI